MNEKIINRMTNIVADLMKSFQSDFTKYDKPYIEAADESKFPMLWIVGESHTHLLRLGDYDEHFNTDEAARYAHAQGSDPFTAYLDWLGGDKIFLITKDEVKETTEKAAREVIRDVVTPVVENWKAKNGPLPKNFKIPVRFKNITLGKLKEMFRSEENCDGRTLIQVLREFRNYRKTADDHFYEVTYYPTRNEFTFCEYRNRQEGLTGGIVFHGWPETGYQQNFAYQIDPSYGWSRHT